MKITIPKTCNNEIQKTQRAFVWEDVDEKKNFHAVKLEVWGCAISML